jgi:hypothetical protein
MPYPVPGGFTGSIRGLPRRSHGRGGTIHQEFTTQGRVGHTEQKDAPAGAPACGKRGAGMNATRREAASGDRRRVWTAVVTVRGYAPMAATWSERDEHDSQIMEAAHDAVRLMRSGGAESGVIDLFRSTGDDHLDEHVERRSVSFDERGLVVSADLGGTGLAGPRLKLGPRRRFLPRFLP